MLDNKVCLITGGAKGIGRSIAELFAVNGAIVYVNDIDTELLTEWIEDFSTDKDVKIFPLPFDICNFQETKAAIIKIKSEVGKLDVLVNNAGLISYEYLSMVDFNFARKMFDVNVFSVINLMQLALRLMKAGGGSIINMASMVAVKGVKGQLSYSASKGAVISLTKSAAKELSEFKIRVNAISPGMVATERLKNISTDKFADKINDIGFKRMAEPDEIAQLALFLASDNSSYITGQIIGVDGDIHL